MFKNKKLLITGGTGSFGNAVLNRFLDTDISEIRIFSRDEKNKMICEKNIIIKKLNSTLAMFVIIGVF
ncbi:UDP-glucose 4-epimerase [Escherichia coli]|nr:UDP-glucose 4-epimerase [Escherichia coli]